MENFIVSARKYRPKAFEEVVGQQHVTNTLQNAIRQNHLAQALLFTGPRGVGKTTCARILARLINTEDGVQETDPDFSFNIFELDAASNNSVDDIRNLIDQVRFAPQSGKYKVYIIDEVHMLSQAAFNAFLKTLEEPPKHAIFILATTEKHKIIPTILSRCQIFDFKRITVEDIALHLKEVARQEGITAEDEALHIIAQKADGALRDALSIFDRIVSFSGNNITYKDVIDNLRILDYDYYFRTTDLILNNDASGLLLLFNEILDNGFDGHLYINGLASHFRDLLVCKDPRTVDLLEVGESTRDRYKQQSQRVDPNLLLKGLKLISECDIRYKGSNNPRLLVELCLLQIAGMNAGTAQTAPEKKKPEPGLEKDEVKQVVQEPQKVQKAVVASSSPASGQKSSTVVTSEEKNTDPERASHYSKLKKARARSGFSINATLHSDEKENTTEEQNEDEDQIDPGLPKRDFSENHLLNLWNEYLEMLRNLQKQKIYGSLTNKKLRLLENFTVQIELENEIQESFFEEEKRNILSFLREKLNNYSLQFVVKITKNTQASEPYSPEEKFQYMVKQNPNLLLLKQKLDLDIE